MNLLKKIHRNTIHADRDFIIHDPYRIEGKSCITYFNKKPTRSQKIYTIQKIIIS